MSLLAGLEAEPTGPQEAASAEASGMISPSSGASEAGAATEPAASSVDSELAGVPPAADAVRADDDPESGGTAGSSELREPSPADQTVPGGGATAPVEPADTEKPATDSAAG